MTEIPQRAVPLVVGQRAWTRPLGGARRPGSRKSREVAQHSDWVFIFDTETTVDAAQQLRVGCFRILEGTGLVQEGLFYEHVTPTELGLLEQVQRDSGIALLSIEEFRDWFFHYVYRLRATVVGHNLPFDLSRLAIDWAPARREKNGSEKFKGGFSFVLWPRKNEPGENKFRPRLRIKALNRRAALIEFGGVQKEERGPDGFWPGRFVDTHTLAAALTDRSLTLDQAAETFGTAHRKLGDVAHGEPLKPEYIEYLRRDVLVTEEVYFKLTAEFARHPIDLDASKAYSSASIGKAYLRAMGISPPQTRSSVPDEVLGYSMSAFYGGRVECRIRHEIVPVTYLDVRSMYPTVFCLLGLQRFLTAEQIDCAEATDEIRDLLASTGPDQLFDQAAWLDLCALCEVEPDGNDVFPIRAEYGAASSRSIGLNYLDTDQPIWFSLLDVIASKVITGRAPKIRRAYRFSPRGRLDSLRPVRLRGEILIDPRVDEIFKLVIEERARIGDQSGAGISAIERFLKVFANSTSYGIFAELNRQERSDQLKRVEVFSDHRFESPVRAVEDPGRYCFPPLAMLITGAARLVLALAEREVTSRGGAYAFCDTDSIAILTDYGELEEAPARRAFSNRADLLRLDQVEEIVRRFDQLSPFSIPGSILKYEPENYREDSDVREPLYTYAVSAKRYVLMNVDSDDSFKIRRFSEHGLGTYTDPSDDGNWKRDLWLDAIARARGKTIEPVPWTTLPAIGQMTVTRPEMLLAFETYNRRNPGKRVRPFNFVSMAYARPFGEIDPPRPVAPFVDSPAAAREADWVDLRTGEEIRIDPCESLGALEPGVCSVRTYGEIASEHRMRPEHKFAAPDGGPCLRATSGQLRRQRIEVIYVEYLGKEGNLLRPEGEVPQNAREVQEVYFDETVFRERIVPILRRLPRAETARFAGVSERGLRDILALRSKPRPRLRRALIQFAVRRSRVQK